MRLPIKSIDLGRIRVRQYGINNQHVLIINSALGVPQKFYLSFAQHLMAAQITVITYDYFGMDGSQQYHEATIDSWGREDLKRLIIFAKQELNAQRVSLLGHSIGGQILGFADNIKHVDDIILVAAQSGDWRNWRGLSRLKMWILWYVMIPLMSRQTWFNARLLGLGAFKWPSAIVKQWASWGRSQHYLFNQKFNYDLSSWRNFSGRLLSIGFADDHMAPKQAIQGLVRQYQAAQVDDIFIQQEQLGKRRVGHFGFFRPSTGQVFWRDVLDWLQQH